MFCSRRSLFTLAGALAAAAALLAATLGTSSRAPAASEAAGSGRRMPVVPRVPRVQLSRWSPTSSGAAALGTVLAAYGQKHPPERLERACGGIGRRATLVSLQQAAQSGRFRAAIVTTDPAQLPQAPLPAIGEWPDGEFRVFINATAAWVELFDPATGRRG